MSAMSRLSSRITAAAKAFRAPHLVRSTKFYSGNYAPMYGTDLTTGSSAMWSKWGAASALLVNHAAFACVTKRTETIVGLPYRVVDKDSRKPLDPNSEPLMRMLALYARHYQGNSFFQEWMYDRDTTGEVFIEPLRDPYTGRVNGLDLLSTLNVTPVSMDSATISYYQYSAGMQQVNIPVDGLVYDRNTIARATAIHGYSPLLVAIGSNATAIVQAAGKAALAYFNNDGVASTIIQPPEGTDDFEVSEVDNIRRLFQPMKHASGKYATAILPYRAEVVTLQQPDLMKWAELLSAFEPQIYTAFRVPRSVAGDSDSTRYQSSPEDRKNYDLVMSATAEDLATVINTAILPLIYEDPEPGVEFEFETAGLDHIDPEERQAAQAAYQDGAITLNEYREVMGYEKVDGGDVYLKPMASEFVTAEAFRPTTPAPMPTPEPVQQERITVTPPLQLPASVSSMAEAEEVEAYGKFVRNGAAEKREFVWTRVDADTAALIEHDAAGAEPAALKSVLATWRTAILARGGVTDYAIKSFDDLPNATRLYIRSLKALGYGQEVWYGEGQNHYARVVGMKALSNVRGRFEAECLRLMTRAVNEKIGKARFMRDMEITLFRHARAAMIEGYADGGIDNYELDEDDDRYLLSFNDEQRSYIQNVAADLYADDVLTEAEIKGKPQMWWNRSVHPAYNEGLIRASKDGIGVYYMGPTEDKCADCPRLHLQARKFSTWVKYLGRELVPSAATQCGGFKCECVITPRQTAISRGSLPRLVGYRKAVTVGIDLEVIPNANS